MEQIRGWSVVILLDTVSICIYLCSTITAPESVLILVLYDQVDKYW